MAETEVAEPSPANKADKKYYTVRQAAFIGVGAMVGAGIFALLGAAGEVAGAAVWLSFVLASIVTLAGILLLSVALDYGWKRSHPRHPVPVQVSP